MAVLKDLIVHGASRFLNGAYFNTINAESIGADAGIFNKLIATSLDAKTATIDDLTAKNATVTALLDVQGELHTNSWSNANIATIDGSFYISPTSSSADGSDVDASGYTPTGTITYNNGNYTKLVVTGTFNTSQLDLGDATNVAWPANSYVIITGDVLVGNEWYPLGTIRGKLQYQLAANADSKSVTVIPIGATIIDGEVGGTSLTDGHGLKPQTLEAIRLASSTAVNGSTTLKMRKIKVSMTSYGGTYQSPIGIFMTAMGSNKKTFLDIYGGNNNTTTIPSGSGALALPVLRIGNLSGLPTLGTVTPSGWGIYTTNGFFSGTIVAKQGIIGNGTKAWTIGTSGNESTIFCGPSSVGATSTAGTYLGTDGFLNTASSSVFAKITGGILTAQGADITGAIKATSFSARDSNSKERVVVDTNGLIVKDTSGNIVSSFGVDTLIGRQASGCYNIFIDADGGISLRNNTTSYTTLTTSALTLGLTSSAHAKIISTGLEIYTGEESDSTRVASFGSTARVGLISSGHVDIAPSGMQIYGGSTYAYSIAHLGYASGSDGTGGTSEAPYFTFGNRIESSNLIFTPSVVFTYGDKINYEGESYVCIVKNSTTGSWNYTQFERIIGNYSTVSGQRNIASGFCSFAEGLDTQASKPYSHAEGRLTKAIGYEAHAEGYKTQATGTDSHAEGYETIANDLYSHAEGYGTKAIAGSTHAEGHHSIASGTGAHAQNYYTVASGHSSHAQNYYTVATRNYQTVIGKFNKATKTGGTGSISDPYTYTDSTDAAFIIGGGTGSATEERADILTVDWNGLLTCNGYLSNNVGGSSSQSHANVLQSWFANHKSTITRNVLLSYYSTAYANGSQYLGYFLTGYDSTPYGGFFVCHYTTPRYVGISNGTFTQYDLTKTATSSRKTKENIKSMTEKEAKKLYDLNVISFDYKKEYEEGKKNQFGLIAEDCDKVIPYVIYKPDDNKDSIWGIDYTKFVPYLIKNLQLHEQKIKELEKEMDALKEEIKALKSY